MKKGLLAIGIACGLGLTACSDTDSRRDDPLFQAPEQPAPVAEVSRIVFNPISSDLNLPNDLLMVPNGNFFDFTLNTEGNETFDPTNPQHALSALDGWSYHQPFAIRVENPDGQDIDPATVSGESIKLFEATQALEGTSAQCTAIASQLAAPGVPCELGEQLEYGVDYVAAYTPGSSAINVVPLKVLKPAQGYMLVVTEALQDTLGNPVQGSGTWDLVRQDVATNQVGVEALQPLQQIVNAMVAVLEPAGVTRESLSYASYFTTQSVGNAIGTVKQLSIAGFAQLFSQQLASGADPVSAQNAALNLLPRITTDSAATPTNAYEQLFPLVFDGTQQAQLSTAGLNTCSGLLANAGDPNSPVQQLAIDTLTTVGAFCAANIMSANVNLPYYLDPNAALTGRWKAACTSGATLNALGPDAVAGLVQAGQVGPNNTMCQLASDGQLFDLDLSSLGVNDPRNITRFSPIPMRQGRELDNPATLYNEAGTENLSVQFTLPNEGVIAGLSAASGGAIPLVTKPAEGWPVIMFQHGITGDKTNASLLSAAFSLAGFATVSIDHPLHGDRAFAGNEDGSIEAANASQSIDSYLNFTSLLTSRDNVRQSISDIMGLRLALNNVIDGSNSLDLDISKVHFIGHSLGSITGTAALAIANQSLGGDLAAFDSMFEFDTAVLNVPGGGIPSFVLDSPDFGPLVKGSLLRETSPEFEQFLQGFATSNNLTLEQAIRPAFTAFFDSLSPEQRAPIDATFASFGYAAQTIIDVADPIGYAALLSSHTPVLAHLVVGGGTNDDGSTAVSDEANSVTVPSLPLVGGQPLADLLGLERLTASAQSGGVVRFIKGNHFSVLAPTASASTTQEMQSQAISFFASEGQGVIISNTDVVEN
jgi:Pla-1/cef family extracellular lipase